jgi:hypothetical protein
MARQINEHEPRLARQQRNLLAPETKIAAPAVNEDKGVASFAEGGVMNPVRADRSKMRLGVCHAGEEGLIGHMPDIPSGFISR